MRAPRFLLMHISTNSGHHRASRAIQETIHRMDPACFVYAVDASQYTSGPVRWAIQQIYYSLIRHQPDVWEYLYDNPSVHRRVQYLRMLMHRYHARKLGELLEAFQPDVILCTQAYPCGMVADFKRHAGLRVPLVGVLTDHAPHLYWFHETVDQYVVPSEQVRQRFLLRGVDPSRVSVLGIPIDPRFSMALDREAMAAKYGLDAQQPVLLVMGGGTGFGRLREIIQSLDTLPYACQLAVLTGTNRSLFGWLKSQRFRHRVMAFGYMNEVHELMQAATLLISKPGGLTTSEALAKQLPMVIVNPIPGQEAYNARFLMSQGVAVQAGSPAMVRQTVRDLLENPERLELMRRRLAELGRPHASWHIAELMFRLAGRGAVRKAPAGPRPVAPAHHA